MAYRTRYGKRYHMTYGCHGATISCDTKGLSPCSDCCGSAGGNGSIGGGNPRGTSGVGGGMPATTEATGGSYDGTSFAEDSNAAGETVMTKGRDETTAQVKQAIEVTESGIGGAVSGLSAPDVSLNGSSSGNDGTDTSEETPKIEGLDYPGKGEGWPRRKRGRSYALPMGGGGGYEHLTRKQAGIVYGAVKRGEVTLGRRQIKEMYNIVGCRWGDLDLYDRRVMMHVDAAVGHILAGRRELAQAELDGHYTEEAQVVVGTRQVVVTEDNWIEFAFDLDHDYEVGDMTEEEVTETVWRIRDGDWD